MPRLKGGSNELENLALACFGCNGRKQAKTQAIDPETGEMANLYNPRTQRWVDHFCWNKDTTRILGKTPTGRATIEALSLNRTNVVNLRRLLASVGLHPPQY
ncbi:hnh endonuclease [Leptolyngbya sp. Heron Island J]|nr:hnh endonuclease [Leptolyngbya sp. Heron Island J]